MFVAQEFGFRSCSVIGGMRGSYIVEVLQLRAQMSVVNGIILGRVVDVRHFAYVKDILLLIVEGLEQLPPPVEHQQQPAMEGRIVNGKLGLACMETLGGSLQ